MPQASNPPIATNRLAQIEALLDGFDSAALYWLAGYLSGRAHASTNRSEPVAACIETSIPINVLYGSQTGHAKRLAEQLQQRLHDIGLTATLLRADRYPVQQLQQAQLLFIVISTQGDGEPPDDARGLLERIDHPHTPSLPGLRYAVLGLGDSSYPAFCAMGRHLDERLHALGAQRVLARGDADVDIHRVADGWLEQALAYAQNLQPTATISFAATDAETKASPSYDREHPYAAELWVKQAITGAGSDREICHLELSLQGSDLTYQPGDALGVWPQQAPDLVDAVLDACKLDGEAVVNLEQTSLPLRQWLTERRELTVLTRPFLTALADLTAAPELYAALAPDAHDAFQALVTGRQVLDCLLDYPAAWTAEHLLRQLRPLAPRLYSIASSPQHVPDEVHLTVAHVQYHSAHGPRWGVASHQLHHLREGSKLPIFIEPNERFRLPQDPDRDIVMIGPGTGVAPFRSFVQQRALQAGKGRNWLFFGNPHSYTDFLYQQEWHEAMRNGHLHRLDVAFSRDQDHKIYVQHRLQQHGAQVFAWLQTGAHLYVCGDALRMARDVHNSLLEIAVSHGHWSHQQAHDWLNQLQYEGRYSRDVY